MMRRVLRVSGLAAWVLGACAVPANHPSRQYTIAPSNEVASAPTERKVASAPEFESAPIHYGQPQGAQLPEQAEPTAPVLERASTPVFTEVELAPQRAAGCTYAPFADESVAVAAARFGMSPEELASANGISSGLVHKGELVSVFCPEPPRAPSEATLPATQPVLNAHPPQQPVCRYQVHAGDELLRIALRFNTTLSRIRSVNQLRSDALDIGQSLIVPCGAQKPPAMPSRAPVVATETPQPQSPPHVRVPCKARVRPGAEGIGRVVMLSNGPVAALLEEYVRSAEAKQIVINLEALEVLFWAKGKQTTVRCPHVGAYSRMMGKTLQHFQAALANQHADSVDSPESVADKFGSDLFCGL